MAHPDVQELEYNYITDGIFIGTNFCCQAHFDDRLVREGIEADLSLEAERVDTPFGVDYYLWLPVRDHTAPTQEQLQIGVTFLTTLVSLKKKIYVHCKNGHGRAPTLVAAYLIRQRNVGLNDVIEFVARKRTGVHLHNTQIAALREFQQS